MYKSNIEDLKDCVKARKSVYEQLVAIEYVPDEWCREELDNIIHRLRKSIAGMQDEIMLLERTEEENIVMGSIIRGMPYGDLGEELKQNWQAGEKE